jgi:hypothetical protein
MYPLYPFPYFLALGDIATGHIAREEGDRMRLLETGSKGHDPVEAAGYLREPRWGMGAFVSDTMRSRSV